MPKGFKEFMERHFAWRYVPIYLYCAIFLISELGSLWLYGSRLLDPAQGADSVYRSLFDADYVDGGAGWARRWFWTQLGIFFLAVYLFFAKALRLRWSLLLGALCAVLSLIPGVFYLILDSGSAYAYLTSATNMLASVHFTIEIFALIVFVMADLSIRKFVARIRKERGWEGCL